MSGQQRSKRERSARPNDAPIADRVCPTGKRRFVTEHQAQIALDRARINRALGNERRRECRYYACHKCRGFHLSSEPKNNGNGTSGHSS